MTKSFSPLKVIKAGLTSLVLAGACLMAVGASAQQLPWIKTSGNQIIDESGKPIFFNGTNLGNWLVWEGYLMVGHNGYLTHSQFLHKLGQVFGDTTKAKAFERNWRLNYVTSDTIDELAGLGYNSVRVPFNYKLFWDDKTSQVTNEGFEYLDRLIGYCRSRNMYILLDMHGAPGFQNPGDHSDNDKAKGWDWRNPAGQREDRNTVTFWDDTTETNIGRNVYIASQVWKHIATRYRNESVIWGYDLINEPVTKDGDGWRLMPSYKHMSNAIRQVDNKHVIVLEGDWWASYMDVFDAPKIDNNIVLQTHHYIHGNSGDIPKLYERAALANQLNVPIILGEFGEEENFDNLRAIADIAKTDYDGSFAWSFKKVSMDKTLWRINPPQSYKNVVYALENGQRAKDSDVTDVINNFAITGVQNRNKLGNTDWFQNFFEKTTNPISSGGCAIRSAFKAVSLPGVVQAEDFDNGCKDEVYGESTLGNAGGAYRANTDVDIGSTADSGTGYYVGWTTPNEWLDYTVDIPQAGDYTFTYRYAAPTNGASITLNAGSASVTTNLNNTAGWDVWNNSVSTPIALSAGKHVIRLTFSGGLNLNSFTATLNASAIEGTFAIISKASGKALEVQGGYNIDGTPVQQWSYVGLAHQKWKIARDGDAYYIIDSNGRALDLPGGNTANGTKLQVWQHYYGSPNQKWKIEYSAAKNSYTIKSIKVNAYGAPIALDVPGGEKTDGLIMQVWSFYPDIVNQEWYLERK